jgi:SnoaL-like domain
MTTTTTNWPHAPLAGTFEEFFRIKTSCDVDGTMAYFSPALATYTDATLGWNLESYDALRGVFAQYMPNWAPPARSYFTGILSNETSALIRMVDTPELFGGELRILAAVDLVDGKIVRWVDYWDAASFDDDLYAELRTPAAAFPTELKEDVVPTQAAPRLVEVAGALQVAFAAADADAAAALLHTDVVLEDMSLRTHVTGRIETVKYLGRVLDDVPCGRSSTLRHVVGGSRGGAFEWTSGTSPRGLFGITALELDGGGLVTRITSVYDSRQLADGQKATLHGAAIGD